MKIIYAVFAVLVLAGCSDPSAAPPSPKIKYIVPKIAAECESDQDPAWQAPTGDETRSSAAWRDNGNHMNFDKMRSDRSVCWAGLKPFKKG